MAHATCHAPVSWHAARTSGRGYSVFTDGLPLWQRVRARGWSDGLDFCCVGIVSESSSRSSKFRRGWSSGSGPMEVASRGGRQPKFDRRVAACRWSVGVDSYGVSFVFQLPIQWCDKKYNTSSSRHVSEPRIAAVLRRVWPILMEFFSDLGLLR